MNIELFVLCDAATDYHGKLNILGAFDTIWAQRVPAVHPQCALALRVRFAKIEEGKHQIKINIADADGKTLIPSLEAGINVLFQDSARSSMSANMIFNLQGLKFQSHGEYSIDLAIDGRHVASLPLYVNSVPGQN